MSKAASFQEHVNSCLLVVVEGEVFIIIFFFIRVGDKKRSESGKGKIG